MVKRFNPEDPSTYPSVDFRPVLILWAVIVVLLGVIVVVGNG